MSKWLNLGALFLSMVSGYSACLAWPPLSPLIKEDLSLGSLEVAAYSTMFFITYTVLGPVAGAISDRVGAKTTILAGVLMGSAGAFLFGSTHSYLLQLAAYLIIGAACTFIFTPGPKIINAWADPGETGLFSGVWSSGIFTASMLTTFVGPLIASVFGMNWRAVFHTFGALGLVFSLVFYAVVRERPPKPRLTDGGGGASKVYTNPWIWIISLVFCSAVSSFWVNANYIPLYANTILPLVEAGRVSSAYGLVGLPAAILSGWLSDRLGWRTPFMIAGTLCLTCSVWIVFFGQTGNYMWIVFIFALVGWGPLFTTVPELALYIRAPGLPPEKIGTAMGLQSFLSYGTSLSMVTLSGWLLGHGYSFFHVFLIPSMLGVQGAVFSLFSIRAERMVKDKA